MTHTKTLYADRKRRPGGNWRNTVPKEHRIVLRLDGDDLAILKHLREQYASETGRLPSQSLMLRMALIYLIPNFDEALAFWATPKVQEMAPEEASKPAVTGA